MTESIRVPAPAPIGDIVAGAPPVPITVWYVPAAPIACTMSTPLALRLIANFTHPRALIIDITEGDQVAQAASLASRTHRRHQPSDLASGRRPAALIVSGWPAGQASASDYLGNCAARLSAGGCVAVVITTGEATVNRILIRAARFAGLTYLQHVVAAHDLSTRHGQLSSDGTHISAHSDVLIFFRPRLADADG
jgi:hypothetical protein